MDASAASEDAVVAQMAAAKAAAADMAEQDAAALAPSRDWAAEAWHLASACLVQDMPAKHWQEKAAEPASLTASDLGEAAFAPAGRRERKAARQVAALMLAQERTQAGSLQAAAQRTSRYPARIPSNQNLQDHLQGFRSSPSQESRRVGWNRPSSEAALRYPFGRASLLGSEAVVQLLHQKLPHEHLPGRAPGAIAWHDPWQCLHAPDQDMKPLRAQEPAGLQAEPSAGPAHLEERL